MKIPTRYIGVVTGFVGVILVSVMTQVQDADAIPAFARKYSMTCTTCHTPMPRLKAYGDEFAGNGFVLKDKDAPRYFVDTGDRNLSLIRDLPIAVRMEGYISYNSETDKNIDFTAPYLLKFLSGGGLGDNLAYYFYFYMNERGEVAGVEDAFLMFNDVFGTELDIYAGQFQISDPLFKRELRLTLEDYMIYKIRVGNTSANLAYDRGVMLTYGFEEGPDIIVEITNGNGLAGADDSHVFDDDKYKAFSGRVSQDVNENMRVGAFGYSTKEEYHGFKNTVWYAGPDISLAAGPAELNVQYMRRHDSNADLGSMQGEEATTDGGFAELIVFPEMSGSPWYAVALYNFVETKSDRFNLRQKYHSATGHIGYLARTNVRLVAEFRYDLEHDEGRFVLGFVSAY